MLFFSVTFTDEEGTFKLDGCADDFDWLPGVPNLPEPYIQIKHYCNSDAGETIRLPEFDVFVPDTYDVGILELDEIQNDSSSKNPKFSKKEDEPLVNIELPTDSESHELLKAGQDGTFVARPDKNLHTE